MAPSPSQPPSQPPSPPPQYASSPPSPTLTSLPSPPAPSPRGESGGLAPRMSVGARRGRGSAGAHELLEEAGTRVRSGALLLREGQFGRAEKELLFAVKVLDGLLTKQVVGDDVYVALGGALMDLGVVLDCQRRTRDAGRCYTDALAAYKLCPGGGDETKVRAVERNLVRNAQRRVAEGDGGGGVRVGGKKMKGVGSKEYYRSGRRSRSLFGSSGSTGDGGGSGGAYGRGRLSGLSYASSMGSQSGGEGSGSGRRRWVPRIQGSKTVSGISA